MHRQAEWSLVLGTQTEKATYWKLRFIIWKNKISHFLFYCRHIIIWLISSKYLPSRVIYFWNLTEIFDRDDNNLDSYVV